MTPPPRAVLLDLDGTLLDTAPDMSAALNALREEEGQPAMPLAALRQYVSHGAIALVRAGFGSPPDVEFERLRLRFLDIYRGRLSVATRPFDGFDAVLGQLEQAGLPWGVVTNKPGWLTEPLMAELGLAARAGCIVSGDTLPQRKPHPAPLLHAARLLDRAPGDCLYVGDAERDIVAGRAAGMRTLAARFGYLAPDEDPAAWQPDGILESPVDLLDWVGDAAGTRLQ